MWFFRMTLTVIFCSHSAAYISYTVYPWVWRAHDGFPEMFGVLLLPSIVHCCRSYYIFRSNHNLIISYIMRSYLLVGAVPLFNVNRLPLTERASIFVWSFVVVLVYQNVYRCSESGSKVSYYFRRFMI